MPDVLPTEFLRPPDVLPPDAVVGHVSAVEAARTFEGLARGLETLFVDVGGWVADAEPKAAEAFATVSRRLGEQAVAWRGLVPESILLADARAAAPHGDEVWGEVAGPDATDEDRTSHLRGVLARLAADARLLAGRLSPVADGAALRQTAVLMLDLVAADHVLDGSSGPVTTNG